MDPNPSNFPILSYVMARFPSMKITAGAGDHYDVEQPPPPSPASSSQEPNFELAERMPHLKDPKLISEMRVAVADVAQTRAMLKNLGERPDHESVDSAKMKLAEVEANLSRQLDEIVLSPKDGEGEVEDPARKALEREKQKCKALISLDEMHEAYEQLLTEAEARLNRLYEAAVEGRNDDGDAAETVGKEQIVAEEDLNEEVVAILKQVEGNEIVEWVNLSGKQLRILPEAFGKIKTLVLLDLSNNQLEAIPDSIAGLENLEELNLSSNLLQDLPDSIGLLFKLKVLDVDRNKLTSLPDSICHCRSLVELKAGFNKFTYLPTNIGHELVNLKSLIVPWNKIRHLPTSIGDMKSLQFLDVHFNELHGIPSSIGKLSSLEILNLSNNFSDLCELPNTIGDLNNLKELNLSNNQIHELPDTIGLLVNLTVLNVDENPLLFPPKEIVKGGVEEIKAFIAKVRLEKLEAEEERSSSSSPQKRPSVLTRSTTWLNNVVSNVSDTVIGYLDGPEASKDPYLNQQL